METLSRARCFGGEQRVLRHRSAETGTEMRFAAFLPPQALAGDRVPVVWFLAGLTCTEENFTVKAGAQRVAAELGLLLVAPDTSPRGEGVPDDPQGAWDFGLGAGFYVDATQDPWAKHYRMRSYIERELPALVGAALPADLARQGIMGHSMGGHGALTIALRHPGRYAAVSAFAPICSPLRCPWGEKALGHYLGPDRAAWRQYDATALIEDGARVPDILVDQGTADGFLDTQLKPRLLAEACGRAGIPLTLRMQDGYDHSYFFIASVMEDHLRWHAARLERMAEGRSRPRA
ncbi:S-formylglutathione hydrolase [Paracraurococcus ruber]|uniref:S-formylglutathione hydrolase n=1 Tax=Paracraurococcus ruber TaxID=77675 RepID=A0ABS1CYF1_9PROT|nr:S-formylglutathione hydrolase [Paracraurococcus ruber]MBK1659565.1 S-formylglutathione hydrolase [Paracraurococcus ruber]TDG31149.1 S-formylglutathione hydrolase [Paracraurococcus ruber]